MRDCLRAAGPTIWVELATMAPRPRDVDLFFPALCFAAGATNLARCLNVRFCWLLIGETELYISKVLSLAPSIYVPLMLAGLAIEGYCALPWSCYSVPTACC